MLFTAISGLGDYYDSKYALKRHLKTTFRPKLFSVEKVDIRHKKKSYSCDFFSHF